MVKSGEVAVPAGGTVEYDFRRWEVRVTVRDNAGAVLDEQVISASVNPGDGIWMGTPAEFEEATD